MSEATVDSLAPFLSLARNLREATIRADERAQATHGRFNVFTTLLKPHDEDRLHTGFLHCLLDPAGLHDCGPLFLRLFFESLGENPPFDHDGKDAAVEFPKFDGTWAVSKEIRKPPFGEIDLLIEGPEMGIVIENKIWAGEQKEQLKRYGDYLTSRYLPGRSILFYLTLDGKASKTAEGTEYFRLSYKKHILPWLEKCLQATYALIPINQALLQYRAVVRQILGIPNDPSIMKEATNFVMKHPEIIRYREAIWTATENVEIRFLDELAEGIEGQLKSRYAMTWYPGQCSFGSDEDGTVYLKALNPDSCPQKAPFKWALQFWTHRRQLLFGGEVKDGMGEQERPLFDRMNGYLKRQLDDPCYREADKGFPLWPTGWWVLIEELNDGVLASELEKSELTSPVRICEKIEACILLLTKAYQEAASSNSQ